MTHYWWMHWFWITFHLTLIHSIDCSTLSPASKVASLGTESSFLNANTKSSEPERMTSTEASNKTILNDSLQQNEAISGENSTSIVADVENVTVIVTQSKELVSCDREVTDTSWTIASITGVCVGVVAVATLFAAVSLVLYRRRYLNKPHALNDKCSNPDSSGYIDDSAVRENSEEMYSLDNDSFLNSLEAMTIQNYWTDSVKHTKL